METTKCEKCDGLGYYPAADGPDDIVMQGCDCPAGVQFVGELTDELAHHD